MTDSIVYGPVPSRRLGRSLGINNIPPKKCSYSCIYCQIGQTHEMQIEPRRYYDPRELARIVNKKIQTTKKKGESIDYLAFVPDGEPTLDINLGKEIEFLHASDKKIAVITNSSLICRDDVRQDLSLADWVSLKIDTVTTETWKMINRPHGKLTLNAILDGILKFSSSFNGTLCTETMIIRDINDTLSEIESTSAFLATVKPDCAYISVPTRPPAERILPACEDSLITAYQIFQSKLDCVQYLTGYEGNAFSCTGDVVEDIMSITAVHPMRKDAVVALLDQYGQSWQKISELINKGKLIELEFQGIKFLQRKFEMSK